MIVQTKTPSITGDGSTIKNKTFQGISFTDDGQQRDKIYSFEDIIKITKGLGEAKGYYMSRTFLYWQDDGTGLLREFAKNMEIILKSHFENFSFERQENVLVFSSIDGRHLLSNGRDDDILVNQVGDNVKLVGYDDGKFIFSVSYRMFSNGIELCQLYIDPDNRNNGIGTFICDTSHKVARYLGKRLLLYPYPPLVEVERLNMNDIQEALGEERLIAYYAERGFVRCLPEYIPVIRVSGFKSTRVGMTGMMSHV